MVFVARFLAIMLEALFVRWVVTGVRSGAINSRQRKVSRDRQPATFAAPFCCVAAHDSCSTVW
jgi:hypothetical protein